MPNYIDRPVPYTLNSMFLKKALPSNLNATIQWKAGSGSISAGKYLQPEVYGGARGQKRFEKALQAQGLIQPGYVAIPTKDAPVDSYGNVPGAFITQILSYLRANPDYQQNRSVQRLKRLSTGNLIKGVAKGLLNYDKLKAKEVRKRARSQKFFAVIHGRNNNPLPSGIYERVNFKFGEGLRRVFAFIPAATYKVTFPFYDIGSKAAKDKFPSKINQALELALLNQLR